MGGKPVPIVTSSGNSSPAIQKERTLSESRFPCADGFRPVGGATPPRVCPLATGPRPRGEVAAPTGEARGRFRLWMSRGRNGCDTLPAPGWASQDFPRPGTGSALLGHGDTAAARPASGRFRGDRNLRNRSSPACGLRRGATLAAHSAGVKLERFGRRTGGAGRIQVSSAHPPLPSHSS